MYAAFMGETLQKILALRKANPGLAQSEIARTLGISRQRVHQILGVETSRKKPLIYFIRRESDGFIKIGRSGRLLDRMQTLRTTHKKHGRLEFIAVVPGGHHAEKDLHKRFAPHRRDGEWFSPALDLMAHISNLSSKAAIETADLGKNEKGISESGLRNMLYNACETAGGFDVWAHRSKIPQWQVEKALVGDISDPVCKALGYEKHVAYKRLDAWEEKSEDTWEKDGK